MQKQISFILGPQLLFFGILLTSVTWPNSHWIYPVMIFIGALLLLYLLRELRKGYKINIKSSNTLKGSWNKKKVVVIIQNSDNQLLDNMYHLLLHPLLSLREKYGLEDISILRGDLKFCLETLEKKRGCPVLVILETKHYRNWLMTNKILNRGATLIYKFNSNTPEALCTTITQSIQHWMTGKF